MHPSKILRQLNCAPQKRFSQNFLINFDSLTEIPSYLSSAKQVIEIGPGLGMVTQFLLNNNFEVSAYEIDRGFCSYLKQELSTRKFHLIEEDFLKADLSSLGLKGIDNLVSNLPYNIASPIIDKITLEMNFVTHCVFGLQKELAERLIQNHGNSLGVFLNAIGETKYIRTVRPGCFYPAPSVDSAWVSWKRNERVDNIQLFRLFIKGAFWGKRKRLENTLLKNPYFSKDDRAKDWSLAIKANKENWQSELSLRVDAFDANQLIDLYNKINAFS